MQNLNDDEMEAIEAELIKNLKKRASRSEIIKEIDEFVRNKMEI
ncbi:MAG: hypothetical protein HeimC3_01450 [Candidatus Heimdallarchaeota archaeon LC_3]|nr:MAG: hypothetical protein HeimC3_01450 [Candidatus Heimdallarchaeota archaeon LC_3]